jgi:2'-5' RNA ligase
MGSTSMPAGTAADMRDHWVWRPDWTPERTCLYWYLTFRKDDIVEAVGAQVLETVRRTSWLDAVPPEWAHVTVADVGFTDELRPSDQERVTAAVAEAVAGEERLPLTLGPVLTFSSALVLSAGPLNRLRMVKRGVRRAASAVLGPRHTDVHRNLFWPHLSLGYVNEPVEAPVAAALLKDLPPVSAGIDVDALTLAAVTRRDGQYQWEVQAQVELLGDAVHARR